MLASALFAAANLVSLAAALPAPMSNHTFAIEARSDHILPVSECTAAKYEELVFETEIEDFLRAKEAKEPSCFIWDDDGCTSAPDDIGEFDFLPSCKRHDFGYRNGKAMQIFDRERVDDQLLSDMSDVCEQFGYLSVRGFVCRRISDAYYLGVRAFGKRKLVVLAQENGTTASAGEVEA